MLRVNNSSLELRPGFNPWVGKIPWRRKWQPTPILLPGKSHGWRSLAGYSLWGSQKSDTTKQLHFHFLNSMYICLVHAQSCPTLCDLMDCSPLGSFVCRILWARILEWVAMLFSRGSSQPRDQTPVSHTAGRFFTI